MLNSPLKITNLQKLFGYNIIFDNINLELNNNEIFGLIGLNGAGKTTLIKTILDLLKADKGDISISGISSLSVDSRKNLKYLPEKFQASTLLKGIEFLEIFNNFNKNKDKTILENVYELADMLSLDRQALDKKVSKYSKGMMQKLGLISTFLDNSKLIILDEPMSGLDPSARNCLKNLLLKHKNLNKTIFFSSHILSDIDEICDRIGILHNNKILFIGTPKELKEKHNQISLEKAFLKEIE